ncbi:disulfide bond formation protein DsbB [Chitinophaga terrae (ex Kim and Jung 2007)]|jgi:hypothetical protein|uniref:hypothetical protein n=1 Tax=Chitinophaga terrae (ex Kim and Jung 2007) TaxID=408074 RepID=UPI002785B92F|nr:hypothetical protein [Chitinophaga terrae (ex Kim and Jung 2007)]MDQ0109560.1 disulfide bond formation protein DsbB [Chitinophaga terrae (ex Kim and Jung 2007)]
MMIKLINWFKNPRNIVFIILMVAVAIYGIIDNNLEIIAGVYVVAFLVGLLVGGLIYLARKLFK